MSFDRLAPHYRWMEALLAGRLLQHCRTRWLSEVPVPRRALLVGEGPGRMLKVCMNTWPDCAFTVLDSSSGMIEQARLQSRRQGDTAPVEFIVADLREWSAPMGAYDLVVTNFFLDCFAPEELKDVVAKLAVAAAPGATWLVSDFQLPPAGWRRLRARLVLGLAYGFFRATTEISARRIRSPDKLLRVSGFILRRREEFNFGLLHADYWQRSEPRLDRDYVSSVRRARESHRDSQVTMA